MRMQDNHKRTMIEKARINRTNLGTDPSTVVSVSKRYLADKTADAAERIVETRHEQHVSGAREQKGADREGVIDLTNDDTSSFAELADQNNNDGPSRMDRSRKNKSDSDTKFINATREKNIKNTTSDVSNHSEKSSTVQVKGVKTRQRSKAATAIELRRQQLEEKLERSKEKMAKSNFSSSQEKRVVRKSQKDTTSVSSRNDAINSNNQDSASASGPKSNALLPRQRESENSTPIPSDPVKKIDTAETHMISVRRIQKQSTQSKNKSETNASVVASESKGDTSRVHSLIETKATEETHRDGFGIKSIEIQRETNDAIIEKDYNSGCSWYFCSNPDVDEDRDNAVEDFVMSIQQPSPSPLTKEDHELHINLTSEILSSLNEGDMAVKKSGPSFQSPRGGIWNTFKYWLDPAPSHLVQTSFIAGVTSNVTDFQTEAGTVEYSVDVTQVIPRRSETNGSQSRRGDTPSLGQVAANNQSDIDDVSQRKDDEENEEQYEDSGTISDAELNSMPASKGSFVSKGLEQTSVSAFEQVRTKLTSTDMSPEQVHEEEVRSVVSEQASSVDEAAKNILGDDLNSVPSVHEDGTAGVSDFCPDDIEPASHGEDSTAVSEPIEKMKEVKDVPNETFNPYKVDSNESLESQRQLLVKELRAAIATFGRYDIRCANISAALGDILDEIGERTHAIRLHKDATTIYSCKLGDDHTITMDAKMRLGTVLENAQQYDEAINMYYLVTVMRRALYGENDPSVADGLVLMAQALRKKSDYMQAIKELKRALKIYRESLGDSHEKVANTVDQIASLYVTVGDFDKSAAILEEVVKLKAATKGMKSKAVAQTLSTLATTYECSEKFSSAMKALKKAYKIYTELGGYSSEDSTATLNRIAQLYEAIGDQNRASIAYLGVLRARKILLGADSLAVGETYFRLGHSLRETGRYDKALKCLKEALPIFVGQGVEMNDMKMVADIMHEMAFINQDKGNYDDAVRIFKQELSVRRKIGQPEFPLIARTLNHLGVAEFELQNNTRALKYLVEALTIFQDRGEQGIECAEVLFNTGLVFDAVHNKERALEAYREATRIFTEHGYSDDHPHLRKAKQKVEKVRRELETR